MSKLLLISIIICVLALPTISARDPNPKRGFKKTLQRVLAYYAFYAFALIFLWGRC